MTDRPDVPAWLQEVLTTTPAPLPSEDLRQEAPAEVLPGDICVAVPFEQPGSPGRLFLVTASADGWCEGMLAGAETELATEVDALVSPQDSGLGYKIAVHSRFQGPIWVTQVLRRIGAVESTVLDDIEKLAWTDDAQVTVTIGDLLQPEGIDPRYPALRGMSAEFDVLTEHCRRHRYDLAQPILDPVLAEVDVLRVLLREPGWEARISDALSSPGFRDRLLGAMPLLSRDELRVVMPFVERAALGHMSPGVAAAAEMIENHVAPGALAAAVAGRGEPAPAVNVLSHRRCWQRLGGAPARLRVESHETLVVFTAVSGAPLQEAA